MPNTERPPMDPETDEADDRQLELALAQGDAYRAAAEHMINEVAQTGGIQRSGDVQVGFAVEEAEGMYVVHDGVLEWQEPDEENIHIEVTIMDAGDGRFVPGLEVTVTVLDADGNEVGTHVHPMLWHPMLLHYGRNWTVPGDGAYTLQIEVAPATFPRHDEVNGRRFGEPVSVSFPDVAFETGQD